MRIALFGGSFDPPHIGHQLACQYVLSTHAVDEVWMLPCAQHPFAKQMAPFAHRAAMCRLASAHLTGVRVCTIEGELPGPSYTLNTVRALSERHPEHEFLLVIGADLLHERERWHGAVELCERVRFIVLGRSQHESIPSSRVHGHPRTESSPSDGDGKPRPHDIRHAEAVDLPPISSTAVRAALAEGKSPSGWLARNVLTYIQEQALYGAAEGPSDADTRSPAAHHREDPHAI